MSLSIFPSLTCVISRHPSHLISAEILRTQPALKYGHLRFLGSSLSQQMSSTKSATTVSKRSATTTPTVGPSKTSAPTTKKTISNKPCKLCAQDTVLAAPSVKRKGDPNALPSMSAAGTSDGRKIGENKLLSKANKNTRYVLYQSVSVANP